jgi:peptide/nickel transport system substrate-binding protein
MALDRSTKVSATTSAEPLKALLLATGLVAALATTAGSMAFYEENLPTTLNPLFSSSMVDYRSQELVFDRLYYHNPVDNRIVSRVIEKGELAEGGKAYKITLKAGMKWHDGKPVTSKDVCFTVNAMLDPNTPSPIASDYRSVLAGCEASSTQEALIRFTRVFHNPQERLGFALLPEAAFGGNTAISPDMEFSVRPTGTGPYKGSRGRRGANFEAYANAHHAPGIGLLALQEGQDPLIQVTTLKNNGVQGIIAVPPPLRADVSATDDLQLKSYDLRSWWFIAVNTKKGALADKRVRQALNLVLDRTQLREYSIGVKPGEQNSPCEFISGPFVQSSPYYNRAVPTVDRSNRASAESLLTSAGLSQVGGRWTYKGAPVALNIGMLSPLDNEAPDLLQQIANQLGAAGFDRQESKISADDWNRTVVTGKAATYDLLIGKWSFGVVEEVNDIFETRSGSRGSNNIFSYSNPSVDAAVAEYNAARTDTAAQDAYHKLHSLLADDLPYLFLWKLDTKSAWRTDVRNNIISPFFYWTDVDGWRY